MDGETCGVELAADWRVLPWWRVITSYTFIQMQLHTNSGGNSNLMELAEGENPHHQVSVRSLMNLPWHLELDLWARYIDNLPAQKVGSYVSFDTRLAWKPQRNLEVSIVGQNLFDESHPEFMPEFLDVFPTEVERSIYGKITWRY